MSPGTHVRGGEQNISSGGSAVDTTIEVGLQTVFDGGSVNGTIIDGGEQHISSGGSAINATLDGYQTVFNGGNATGTTINGGFQNISSGGSATSTIINAGFRRFPVVAVLPAPLLMPGSRLSTIAV
ncbi:hypothetical protein ACLBOM_35990 [Escherichia coli]